ncbi:hypothetical protein [Sinorhizobium sp. BG8]|uniref:hypothetical protein n=1 Tax=Sinorhizobium sp. BG8 TaxID=2613773 RepID=UPI00193D414C|nr:hypothetical protein [Sinorhizobium sp. BG8]QRM54365.1 hypothetical protein F3Y30_07245 [Sinorhizobium sp. BG8]
MNIEELLKQQSAWVDRAVETAFQITQRGNGTTPEEAGLEQSRLIREIETRIRTLEARREATLKAFDAAIEAARRSLSENQPNNPTIARAKTTKPASTKTAAAKPVAAKTAAAKRKPRGK